MGQAAAKILWPRARLHSQCLGSGPCLAGPLPGFGPKTDDDTERQLVHTLAHAIVFIVSICSPRPRLSRRVATTGGSMTASTRHRDPAAQPRPGWQRKLITASARHPAVGSPLAMARLHESHFGLHLKPWYTLSQYEFMKHMNSYDTYMNKSYEFMIYMNSYTEI